MNKVIVDDELNVKEQSFFNKIYRTSTYLKDSFIFIQKWFSFIDNF